MAEPAEEDETDRARKSNGVEKWTAFVLTLTLGAVAWYACEAKRQTDIANQNLELANRPIIAVSTYVPCQLDDAHRPNTFALVNISNYGHVPVKVTVHKKATVSDEQLASGPDPMESPSETLVVPPGSNSNRIDYPNAGCGDKKGWYYLAGYIEYETAVAKYHTRFCLEFPQPNTLPYFAAQLCADPKANDIN